MSEVKAIIPGVMYLASSGALFTTAPTGEKVPTHSKLDKRLSNQFVAWGPNNRMPFEMAKIVKSSTVLAPAMKKMARLLYGDGVKYEVFEKGPDGKHTWVEGNISEIDDWMEESDINTYFRNACYYHYHYENVFVGIQTNLLKNKVTRIWCEKSEQVRYSWQDDNGYIPLSYINANWELSNDVSKALKVPVLDATYQLAKQIERTKGSRFLLPLSLEEASAGENFYTTPTWYSAVLSDWVKFAKSIPAFKSAMMENQITPKYHIEIDTRYWTFKYGDEFSGFSEKKKSEIIKAHIQEFNANMKGDKNAFNTLVTHIIQDGDQTVNLWTVNTLDNKIKTGIYVEDSQEASSHLLYSLGCDAALIGGGPGKGFGAGSGSDKNAAYNIFMMEAKPIHDQLLRPIIAASRLNGFSTPNRRVRWKVGRPMMVQMESGKPKANSEPDSNQSNP